jgi:hypothetical protein
VGDYSMLSRPASALDNLPAPTTVDDKESVRESGPSSFFLCFPSFIKQKASTPHSRPAPSSHYLTDALNFLTTWDDHPLHQKNTPSTTRRTKVPTQGSSGAIISFYHLFFISRPHIPYTVTTQVDVRNRGGSAPTSSRSLLSFVQTREYSQCVTPRSTLRGHRSRRHHKHRRFPP